MGGARFISFPRFPPSENASETFDRIMTLCQDRESSEPELISQLKSVPRTNYVLAERDSVGWTLLKAAAVKRSVELIKELLVETDGGLDCVRATDGVESLHTACYNGNIEAVKYLYTIYSEGINIASDHGKYPLHFALDHNGRARDDRENLTRFLLHHDQGAVSKPAFDGDLALHFACTRPLEIAKLVFNAYPQAIHTRNNEGETPLDGWRNVDARTFLEAQLQWERQAREQRQPDEQGRLPIHRFLQTPEVSVGTVELMISANPESATALDNAGLNPLHYACNFGQVDVVKLLVDSNENSLKQLGLSGELPLHLACREGKCGVINCILGRSDYGVSSRNKDGHLPIELLLFCEHDVDRDSLEYVEAMHRLLRGYPCVMENLNGGNSHDDDKSREASSRFVKRKHANI